MSHTARHVHVSGRVQGVGFRAAAQAEARRRGITGWVRNVADGRVEAWIQGHRDDVEGMLEWLSEGPSMARVDELEVRVLDDASDIDDFEIRATARV